jgi:hypothetical protein
MEIVVADIASYGISLDSHAVYHIGYVPKYREVKRLHLFVDVVSAAYATLIYLNSILQTPV